MAGAGGVALRGALALDPERYEIVFVTGEADEDLVDEGTRGRPRGRDAAAPAQRDRSARRPPGPRRPAGLPARASTWCTRTAPRRARSAAMAAHRLEIGRIVHTFHGFPFHQFQSWPRRTAYIQIERSVGRFTDVFLAVGSAVAAEAITRRIAPPERVRTIGVGLAKALNAPGRSDRAEARRMLGVPPGMQVVGTVGRLAFQKAPEDFVRALAGLGRRDVFGVWIGDGPLRAKTERLARQARPVRPHPVHRRAQRRGGPAARAGRLRDGQPVRGAAVRHRRGDERRRCRSSRPRSTRCPTWSCAGETGLLVPPGMPDLLGRALGLPARQPGRRRPARRGGPGPARRRHCRRTRSAPCSPRPTGRPGVRRPRPRESELAMS